MEKLSRVKKYEDLRNQIDSSSENNENRIEPLIFKKMEIDESPKREKEIKINESDTFVNEYMDDLIKDVKKYNLEKGLIQSDITELDILNQLKNPTRLKREDYVQVIEDDPKLDENTIAQSKQEIAMQIQQLLNEENEGMNVSKVEPQGQPISEEVVNETETGESVNPEEIQRLNEQTTQIKIKMEKQEENIADLSQDIDKTNRLLNFILIILVISLFVVIGITVFTVLKSSGKI